jgi:hypothetical protein
MARLVRLFVLGFAAFAVTAGAVTAGAAAAEGRVPIPMPAKGKGVRCVAPVEVMRRSHMDLLTHQRDETVRAGIRGKKFSLQECVECHATPVKAGAARSVQPFCSSCHAYAAVKIDCFECHSTEATSGSGR